MRMWRSLSDPIFSVVTDHASPYPLQQTAHPFLSQTALSRGAGGLGSNAPGRHPQALSQEPAEAGYHVTPVEELAPGRPRDEMEHTRTINVSPKPPEDHLALPSTQAGRALYVK
jgi:hypothetical protein